MHLCALLTFLWWYFIAGAPAGQALLTASAVLIITCPCALALAVPAVQVIATGRLFRTGILLKSPTALERLAEVDTVIFDKTGTLTEPLLGLTGNPDPEALHTAATIALASRHPLARSLVAATGAVAPADGVIEHPGQGLSLATPAGEIRLGSREFCAGPPLQPPTATGGSDKPGHDDVGRESSSQRAGSTHAPASGPEIWLARPGREQIRFTFDEQPRIDATETIARLHRMGLAIRLVSGDRPEQVARIARALGIQTWQAACTPIDKVTIIEAMRANGRTVLMVGDGMNDSPALAAASVSASPATAADISQTVADLVFQGAKLAPVAIALRTSRGARTAMRQNLALSIGYNILMVPLAVGGCVTPWLAAAAMSGSSLLVMANSLRLHRSSNQ